MDLLHAVLLALVQGITEFLPISSSAHLILMPRLFDWTDQGLAFDVAVHLGTLLAVVAYFRADIRAILLAWTRSLRHRNFDHADARMGWAILLATLPLVAAGFLLQDLVETTLRSPLVIAASTAFFGILLWLADRRPQPLHSVRAISLGMAMIIGLAQVVALVPGTSRSGITMTAGLMLGLDRQTAARFSFLLSIPAIAGASVLEIATLLQANQPAPWLAMGVGLVVAGVGAWLCIKLFLSAIERIGMLPFVIYRLVLAAVILVFFI